MKTNLLRTSIVAMLAASAAFAQGYAPIRADVPFDFVVGNRTLRAGQYAMTSANAAGGSIVVKAADNKGSAIVLGSALYSVGGHAPARLVFHRYGNTCFLAEVWGSDNVGRQVPKTSRERELSARVAAPENIILAALR